MYALLLLNLIVPFVMISVGKILENHPTKNMDNHNGYNTPTSRKSQKHWDYAQEIAPHIFVTEGIKLGVVEIALSILLFLLQISVGICITAGILVGFLFLLRTFMKTDSKIKEHFQNN